MLTTIREKTQGIIATFILSLLALTFVAWGINSYENDGSSTDIASVDGESISERAYRMRLELASRKVDPRLLDNPAFKKQIVDGLVDEFLLLRDAQEQGFRIDDERLGREIQAGPNFQSEGKFSYEAYARYLAREEGMSPSAFEANMRARILMTQVQYGLAASGIVAESDISMVLRLMSQQREISYLVIDSEKLQSAAAPTADAVEKYYKDNEDQFRTPELVRVEYVQLSPKDVTGDAQPTESELRKAYIEDPARQVRPETRRVSHILLTLAAGAAEDEEQKVLAKAQEIEKQLRAGTDFAKLAREQSQDSDSAVKGGDIGNVSADSAYPNVLVSTAASLKPGEISKPIRTEFGYHLVKLNAYAPAVQKSYEEMKPALLKQLRQRKFQEKYFETTETFRNTVYEQGASLAPVAEALGLKIQTSDWFDRNGGSGIAAHPRVVDAAFSNDVLTQNRNSDAFDIPGDTLVSVRLAGHRPSTVKPLAEVRPQIERVLRQEVAQKAAREKGEALAKEAVSGQSIESLARKHGYRYFAAKTMARNQTGGFDPIVVDAAFRAERPKDGKAAYGGVDLGNKGYAVFALTRVKDGDPEKVDESTKSRAAQMLEVQRGQNYYMNYHAGLKKKSDIKVHQNRF